LQYIASGVANQKDETPLQFGQPFANNEIGYLAHTIRDSFNRLHAALQRETDFSRDISHELRTPVAVLKLVSGRIHAQEPLDKQTVNKVTAAINEIEQSLNVLLALSREESIETESLSLLQEVEHCIINHFALSNTEDAELTVNIPSTYRINCNRNLLQILLNNLLDNVINHASRVALTIDAEGQELTFKNPIGDLPNDDVLAPQVKAPTSNGLGQGLHLVRRICEKCGWTVAVETKSGEFSLKITLIQNT
jgi:signal transduction histidine kinase